MTESHGLNEDADAIFRDHLAHDVAARGPLTSGEPAGEHIDRAREADDLEQDPDAVPNRVHKPQPPTLERVGPWDDEDLED